MRTVLRSLLAVLLLAGCASPRDLNELVLEDSTYYEPDTMVPYSGKVFRPFPDDPSSVEIEGSMKDGTWHGRLTVYHVNGRIRYDGVAANGVPCGAWTENADERPRETIYEELVQDIESMGIYPPCPEGM